MSTPSDTRGELAARQAALVAALMVGKSAPAHFDRTRFIAAAAALRCKRQRALARTWPELSSLLAPHFATYAANNPLPRQGGALADGRRFASWLAAHALLPDACRPHMLAVDLHYAQCASGLLRRRWPVVKVARQDGPGRFVLAVRWSWLGEWRLNIPFFWRWRRSYHKGDHGART